MICAFNWFSYAIYLLDLAFSDVFLSPNVKKCLPKKRFGSNTEIIDETNAYFEDLEKVILYGRYEKVEISLE